MAQKRRRSVIMSVNGVTSNPTVSAYDYASTANVTAANPKTEEKSTETQKTDKNTVAETGAVYEPSKEAASSSVKKTYTPDTNLVNKLKADAEARTQQLRSLVEKMMTGQADTFGKANNIWSVLREGKFTVDPATRLQAQEDISEDGYWGVKQTSDRIIDFAKALTGGDPKKIEEMRSAFEKGYKQAEKTWGGKLPDISQRTYDAVMEKFDKMAEESKQTAANTVQQTKEATKSAAEAIS